MKVFTDLKTRGCQDILIAVTDGLKGMSEALAAIFPATTLQRASSSCCGIVSTTRVGKSGKALAVALRPIYTVPSADAAGAAVGTFERSLWRTRFPTVVAS